MGLITNADGAALRAENEALQAARKAQIVAATARQIAAGETPVATASGGDVVTFRDAQTGAQFLVPFSALGGGGGGDAGALTGASLNSSGYFTLADANTVVTFDNTSTYVYPELPLNSAVPFPIGTVLLLRSASHGSENEVPLYPASGVTINGVGNRAVDILHDSLVMLVKVGTDAWTYGALAADTTLVRQLVETRKTLAGTADSTLTLDPDADGSSFFINLSGDCTVELVAPWGPVSGEQYISSLKIIVQVLGGHFEITWPDSFKWAGGVAPTFSAIADGQTDPLQYGGVGYYMITANCTDQGSDPNSPWFASCSDQFASTPVLSPTSLRTSLIQAAGDLIVGNTWGRPARLQQPGEPGTASAFGYVLKASGTNGFAWGKPLDGMPIESVGVSIEDVHAALVTLGLITA